MVIFNIYYLDKNKKLVTLIVYKKKVNLLFKKIYVKRVYL